MSNLKMQNVIETIIKDVDPDIAELMMSDSHEPRFTGGPKLKVWELVENPALVIVQWQMVRELKKK